MLDSCAPCSHALWTLWGLRYLGQYRFWVRYFVTPRRGRLRGGATPSWSSFHNHNMFFSFNRYPLDTRKSYDFSRLAHPWQTHYCQSPRMVQLVISFPTPSEPLIFFPIHSHSLDSSKFQLLPGMDFIGSFSCQYTNFFKGVTSLGRCTCPDCIIFSYSHSLDTKSLPYPLQRSALCHSVCFLGVTSPGHRLRPNCN